MMRLIPLVVALFLATPSLAFEERYLTPNEALVKVLPAGAHVDQRMVPVTPEKKKLLERHLGRRLDASAYTFHIGRQAGRVVGYAMILDEIGKHEPITFAVGLTPQLTVHDVAVMVYREKVGSEVKRPRFLQQFRGKTSKDKLTLNQDILPLSGATMSSAAISAGVKRALVLTKVLLLGEPL